MLTAANKLDSLRARLERKIWKDLVTGCWNWTAAVDTRGYPRIRFGNEVLYAYHATVLVYRGVTRDAQVKMRITCGNRRCVNPDHVEIS